MSIIKPGAPGKSKALLFLVLLIFLFILLSAPYVMEGLFFIISGKSSQIISGFFRITAFPTYSGLGQSESVINIGSPVTLFVRWTDSTPLDYAWLATNETGEWVNRTGAYGSPMKMSGFSGWSNFTWSSPTFYGTVYWKIYANDSSGGMNSTEIMSFQVLPTTKPPVSEPTGGGGVSALPRNFTVDREFIKTAVKQGETILEYIRITNTGGVTLEFNISLDRLENNTMLSEDSFILIPGESKSVTVAFSAREDMAPEIYSGRLHVTAADITKTVILIMEVKARKSLFDIYVSLPETPLEVTHGQEVDADILLYNFGDIKPADVVLYYSLRDFDGNDIIFNHETLAVNEQRLVKRSIRMPRDLEYGFYLFYARIEYSNQTATSSGLIKLVEEKPEAQVEYSISYIAIMLFSILIIASILAFTFWKIRRKNHYAPIINKRRISEERASIPRMKRMKKDIEDLEQTVKSGKPAGEENQEIEIIKDNIRKLRKKGRSRR